MPPSWSTRAAALCASAAIAAADAAYQYWQRWGDVPADSVDQRQYVEDWVAGAGRRASGDAAAVEWIWQSALARADCQIEEQAAIAQREAATATIWRAHMERMNALYVPPLPNKIMQRAEVAAAAAERLRAVTEQRAEAAAARIRAGAAKRIAAAEARASTARAARLVVEVHQDKARKAAVAAERERTAAELAPHLRAWRIGDYAVAVEDFDSAGRRAAVVTCRTDLFSHARAVVEPMDADLPILRGGFCGLDDPGHDAEWVGKTLGAVVAP